MKRLAFIYLMLLMFTGASSYNADSKEEILLPYSTDPVKDDKVEDRYVLTKYMNPTLGESKFSGLTIFSTAEYQKSIYETKALLANQLLVDSMDIADRDEILRNTSKEKRNLSYQFDLGIRLSTDIPSGMGSKYSRYKNILERRTKWEYVLQSKMANDTSDSSFPELIVQENVNWKKDVFRHFSPSETQRETDHQKTGIGGEDDVPSFGPRIGISIPQISPKQLTLKDQSGTNMTLLNVKNAKIGIDVGVFGRIHIKKGSEFFIQSELYFSTEATAYRLENLATLSISTVTERYYDLNLPIHFGAKYKIKNRVYFRPQAGFIFGKKFGNEKNLKRTIPSYEQTFRKLNAGWQLGLGMDVRKLRIDLRYGGDFSRYANHMRFYGNSMAFAEREKQLEVSIGWAILRMKRHN